jgi:hypothetical protein
MTISLNFLPKNGKATTISLGFQIKKVNTTSILLSFQTKMGKATTISLNSPIKNVEATIVL